MQNELTFLVVLFLIIATYLYLSAYLTSDSETSMIRLGLSVNQSYRLSSSLFVMAVILLITGWFGFPFFVVLF